MRHKLFNDSCIKYTWFQPTLTIVPQEIYRSENMLETFACFLSGLESWTMVSWASWHSDFPSSGSGPFPPKFLLWSFFNPRWTKLRDVWVPIHINHRFFLHGVVLLKPFRAEINASVTSYVHYYFQPRWKFSDKVQVLKPPALFPKYKSQEWGNFSFSIRMGIGSFHVLS